MNPNNPNDLALGAVLLSLLMRNGPSDAGALHASLQKRGQEACSVDDVKRVARYLIREGGLILERGKYRLSASTVAHLGRGPLDAQITVDGHTLTAEELAEIDVEVQRDLAAHLTPEVQA